MCLLRAFPQQLFCFSCCRAAPSACPTSAWGASRTSLQSSTRPSPAFWRWGPPPPLWCPALPVPMGNWFAFTILFYWDALCYFWDFIEVLFVIYGICWDALCYLWEFIEMLFVIYGNLLRCSLLFMGNFWDALCY